MISQFFAKIFAQCSAKQALKIKFSTVKTLELNVPLHFVKMLLCGRNAMLEAKNSGELWQKFVDMSPCEDGAELEYEYDSSDFYRFAPSDIIGVERTSPAKRREITISFSNASALEQNCPEGVRIYESSDSLSEMESRCLQVANIPSSATENDLRQLFTTYGGDIEELDTNNMQRGLVLVRFYDLRAARRLRSSRLQIKSNTLIMSYGDAKPVSNVRKPPNNGTIVVFRLPQNITDEDLLGVFERFGEIRQIRSTPSNANQRFIEYWDIRDAAKALKATHRKYYFGAQIVVDYSMPSGFKKHLEQLYSRKLPTIERLAMNATR